MLLNGGIMGNADREMRVVMNADRDASDLTKAEYFAIKALQGILAADTYYISHPEQAASTAVEHALALLDALEGN